MTSVDPGKVQLSRNTAVSAIHAVVVAALAVIGLSHPDARADLIFSQSAWCNAALSLSTGTLCCCGPFFFSFDLTAPFVAGYFLHDTLDMYEHSIPPFPNSIYLHHATVLVCFLSALWHGQFSGYLSAALIVEFHGMFLHARQLLKLNHVLPTQLVSRLVRCGNLATLVVFRLVFHTLVTCHVWATRATFPSTFSFSIAFFGMLIVSYLNITLAKKLVR